jgi:hypothetical protein
VKDVHPGLIQLASEWGVFSSTRVDRMGIRWSCLRCKKCHDVIMPEDQDGILGHLMMHHGWRMDGRRFDNRNVLLETL